MGKISSLAEYVERVEAECESWKMLLSTTTHPWFRGQSDASWELLPRLYRVEENPICEREMVRDFKLRGTAFLEYPPTRDVEWLFIMQHYGMPTRLLDWTESHLAALYFAVLNYKKIEDAAVWILDPWSLNIVSIDIQSVPTSDNAGFKKYTIKLSSRDVIREVEGEMPVALRPLRNTPRIVAQKGTFTIHGKQTKSINRIVDDRKAASVSPEIRLSKLTIDGHKRLELLKQLFLAGISHSTMFPDLDGLSRDIHFRYSKEYMKRSHK